MSDSYTDSEIIQGIKNRDREVMRFLYHDYQPMIRDFVKKNSGTDDDAMDLFQEGLVVMFEKVSGDNLSLKSSFRTYLYAVCRNKWLMVLRKRRSAPQMVMDTEQLSEMLPDTEKDWLKHQRYEVYRKHFQQLSQDCQKVLNMFLKGYSLREIAGKMGFTEGYAKKRKFTCQKHLITAIEQDTLYRELSN